MTTIAVRAGVAPAYLVVQLMVWPAPGGLGLWLLPRGANLRGLWAIDAVALFVAFELAADRTFVPALAPAAADRRYSLLATRYSELATRNSALLLTPHFSPLTSL